MALKLPSSGFSLARATDEAEPEAEHRMVAVDALGNARRLGGPQSNIRNETTGLGKPLTDKIADTEFTSIDIPRPQAEQLYRSSWAIKKIIDIPVDDIWVRGRKWTDDDEDKIKLMEDAEEELRAHDALARAMKAGRLFGSAIIIIATKGDQLEDELDVETLGEGDVVNLIVVDRWSLTIKYWHTDPLVPHYGQPYMYTWNPALAGQPPPEDDMGNNVVPLRPDGTGIPDGMQRDVHFSRCIRFDGRRALLDEGWLGGVQHAQAATLQYGLDRDFGVSEILCLLDEVKRDAAGHGSVAQLMQVASVLMLRIHGFKDAVKGRPSPGDPTVEELANKVNELVSVYGLLVTDVEDEAERLSVQFGGIALIMDRLAMRLAAAADIPATRFLAQSPAGMNATGESDAVNYAVHIASLQKKLANSACAILDKVLARHAGISDDPPKFEWLPLLAMSEEQKAMALKTNMEALKILYDARAIDENEMRERASQEEYIGELEPLPDERLDEIEEQNFPPQPDPNMGGNEGGDGGSSAGE